METVTFVSNFCLNCIRCCLSANHIMSLLTFACFIFKFMTSFALFGYRGLILPELANIAAIKNVLSKFPSANIKWRISGNRVDSHALKSSRKTNYTFIFDWVDFRQVAFNLNSTLAFLHFWRVLIIRSLT